jgi:glutaconyl-CoA/methylmalonyl-CoA decarboxylase subunit gamma
MCSSLMKKSAHNKVLTIRNYYLALQKPSSLLAILPMGMVKERCVMRYFVTLHEQEYAVDIESSASGSLHVKLDGKPVDVDLMVIENSLSIRIDNQVVDLTTEGAPPDLGLVNKGHRVYARVESERFRMANSAAHQSSGQGQGTIASPMPGRVVKILVAVGDSVAKGDPVIVVEAMKMENELTAAKDGIVEEIYVDTGATVESGAKLVRIS